MPVFGGVRAEVLLARVTRSGGFMLQSRIRAAIVLLLALAATLSAQQPQEAAPPAPPPAQQPTAPQSPAATFRGGITYIRVDATVTDKRGNPVVDLKQSDFEILEDGKPQTIDSFKLIRVDGNPKPGDPPPRRIVTRDDEETEAARDDVRVFVILLDDYHVRAINALAMRQTLTRFIQTQLRPMDLVAVIYPLTPVTAMGFTRNFDGVMKTVQQFEGRKYDYRPRNQFEEQYMRLSTEAVEQIRNDVVMGALKGISVRLGSLREARKTVILVSEGLTGQLPAAMRSQDASRPDMPCMMPGQVNCNPAIGNPTLYDNPTGREDTASWFQQSDMYSKLRDVFDLANRNNVSIYTLDPRGLATNEFGIDENIGPQTDRRTLQMTQDTLKVLAEQTDGRAIVNRNSLDQGLAQITKDASFYYLLGYNSANAPTDGKFHEIKVRVKRPATEIRARRGYWAVTAEDLAKAANPTPETAKPIQQALASIATSVQSGKYVRTWVGTERGESGKTRLTFIWEPLPATPGNARREQPGRVALLAASEAGDLLFRGRTPETARAAPAAGAAASAAAAPAGEKLVFDVPPGKIELRLTVEGADGLGTLDQEIRTIDVPDFTSPQAALSTPRVYRARTVPEFRTIASSPDAVPNAGREFSRTERLLIRFDTYGPGGERPAPAAALMNRSGQKMADVPITPASTGTGHQIDMSLNTIAPGEYLIELTVKGASGGEAKELIPFRVTN
jgi:VWFA-related protein